MRERSKYQLCTFDLRAFSAATARSLNDTGDSPGGQPSPFCEQLNVASTCHSSTFSGVQPRLVTQSATSSTSNSRQSLPTASRSCSAPVLVSACTTASTFGRTF